MKSITPLLVIPALAAFTLVGCNQNTPVNSTDTQSTNAPATNNLSIVDTNTPASINAPTAGTNAPAGTNQ